MSGNQAPQQTEAQSPQHATQPTGITGALGSRDSAPVWAGKVNGSLARAGKSVGVKLGCGSRGVSAGCAQG